MKVLLCVTSLEPAYGGPAQSVGRLGSVLADVGVDVGLWTSDGSVQNPHGSEKPSPTKRLQGSLASALASFGKPDIIHDNGIWLGHHRMLAHRAARMGVPRVVSPRGMLEPWAIKHKGMKKKIAWLCYQKRDLVRASALHVTGAREQDNLRQLDLGVPIHMIPNGTDIEPLQDGVGIGSGIKTALFLGRIYPVKGLPTLIEAWRRVRPDGWQLIIAGPDESGHKAEVEARIRNAQLADSVSFAGPLDSKAKRKAFAQASLLVLPSHSESFGMVVSEALAHGVPVLTTTGTPWIGLIEHRCGWYIPPTVTGIEHGLRLATGASAEDLRDMGNRGREWMRAEFSWKSIGEQFIRLYDALLRKPVEASRLKLLTR